MTDVVQKFTWWDLISMDSRVVVHIARENKYFEIGEAFTIRGLSDRVSDIWKNRARNNDGTRKENWLQIADDIKKEVADAIDLGRGNAKFVNTEIVGKRR